MSSLLAFSPGEGKRNFEVQMCHRARATSCLVACAEKKGIIFADSAKKYILRDDCHEESIVPVCMVPLVAGGVRDRWREHDAFVEKMCAGGRGFLSARVILEWYLSPHGLPEGNYFFANEASCRLEIADQGGDRKRIFLYDNSNIYSDHDWLWRTVPRPENFSKGFFNSLLGKVPQF